MGNLPNRQSGNCDDEMTRLNKFRSEVGEWAVRHPKIVLVILALCVLYGYFHFGLESSSWMVTAWRVVTLLGIAALVVSPYDRIKVVKIEQRTAEPHEEIISIDKETNTVSFPGFSDTYFFQNWRNIEKDYNLFLSKILTVIKRTFAGHTAAFYFYDVNTDSLNAKSVVSEDEHTIRSGNVGSEEKIFGKIFERSSPYYSNERDEVQDLQPFYMNGNSVSSLVATPVVIEDEIRGVVVIDCLKKNAYSDEDMPLIESYAEIIAETIVNYNSLSEFEHSAQLFSYFYEVSRGLISNLKLDEILDLLVSVMKGVINYDRLTISEYTTGSDEAKIIRVSGQIDDFPENTVFPLDEGLTGWIIRNKKTKLMADIEKNEYFLPRYHSKEKTNYNLRSFFGVPVSYHKVCFGAITVESAKPDKYSVRDEKILTILANNFGVALERGHALQQLELQATTDGLTQLYNYRMFMQRIANEVERSIRYDQNFTLLMVDIDYFKQINDTYGHRAGDKILMQIASTIKKSLRNVDFVSRYGGEEFAVILVETQLKDALYTAERIRENIANMHTTYEKNVLDVTVSIGAVEFPNNSKEAETLIHEADMALYEAKSKGRNRIVTVDSAKHSIS